MKPLKNDTRPNQTSDRVLRVVVTSDQHNGHSNTPTEKVLFALSQAYSDSVLEETDLALLTGDFFDHDLSMSQKDVSSIYFWILDFLERCAKWNVIVRVLEGTPSHDYRQPKWFGDIAFSHRLPVDVRYVDKLSIEHIEPLGIDVLYIPDEWRVKCEDTKLEVAELLAVQGLAQVDLVAMHGCFPHQFPKFLHARIDCHDPVYYTGIARHCVCIGHVHTFSQYKNILVPGSIERLTHGQEEPKGHLHLTLNLTNPKKNVYTFIENIHATKYVTFKLNNESMSVHNYRLANLIQTLPAGSHIRLEGSNGHPFAETLKELKDNHSIFIWSYKKTDNEKPINVEERLSEQLDIGESLPNLAANLKELVSQRVNADPDVLSILEECMNV